MSTSKRTSLTELKSGERFSRPTVREAYEETRVRFELAEVVRARRDELGWSQQELGRRAGMTQSSVARFEAGGTQPTIPTLEKIAGALGLRLTVTMDVEPAARSDSRPDRAATNLTSA